MVSIRTRQQPCPMPDNILACAMLCPLPLRNGGNALYASFLFDIETTVSICVILNVTLLQTLSTHSCRQDRTATTVLYLASCWSSRLAFQLSSKDHRTWYQEIFDPGGQNYSPVLELPCACTRWRTLGAPAGADLPGSQPPCSRLCDICEQSIVIWLAHLLDAPVSGHNAHEDLSLIKDYCTVPAKSILTLPIGPPRLQTTQECCARINWQTLLVQEI